MCVDTYHLRNAHPVGKDSMAFSAGKLWGYHPPTSPNSQISSTTFKRLHTPPQPLHITYQFVYWFRQGTRTEGMTEWYSNCNNHHGPISSYSHHMTEWNSYHLFTNNRKTTGDCVCSNTTVEKWLKAWMSRANTVLVWNHRATVWTNNMVQWSAMTCDSNIVGCFLELESLPIMLSMCWSMETDSRMALTRCELLLQSS